MARYALDAADRGAKALRYNGMINIAFGLIGLVAVLVVSPWGLLSKPVWNDIELYKCLLAAVAFAAWALVGWLSIRDGVQRWALAACCPLALALLIGFAIPDRVIDSKQPQFITDIVSDQLVPSRYVLTNSVGVAAGLAWELNRSDVIMFGQQGELKYGLAYPDAKARYLDKDDFESWLAMHRSQGPVSLVLQLNKGQKLEELGLPKADNVYEMSRMVFLQYLPQ